MKLRQEALKIRKRLRKRLLQLRKNLRKRSEHKIILGSTKGWMIEMDTELTNDPDGKPHRQIDPRTGQQLAYVVLSEDERALGFVEPVRLKYRHVGPVGPRNPVRDLFPDERERFSQYGYVKFEAYPGDETGITGKYWTQEELDRVNGGCGTVTTMARSIAETYAREPEFYGGTFCSHCRKHFPVGARGEFVWDDGQRVGTRGGVEP